MKKMICLLLCIFILSGILAMPVSALGIYGSYYERLVTAKLITNVDVIIASPVVDQTPAGTCTITTAGCELYKIDPVTWTDSTGKFLKSTDKFQEGERYTVSIWVAAKSGYEFQTDASGKPKLTGSINGDLPPYINKAYEQDPTQVVELTYTFGDTQKVPETVEPTKPATPTESVHTHTPSQWRITGAYHYTACTTCGDFLEQEDHRGGMATCSEKGKCSVCGYEYLEENENHTPDTSKWVARMDMYHYHACKYCGAHCDIEDHRWSPTYLYQDATGHGWVCADCKAHSTIEQHNPGPAATETTAQTCKDCGYILEPAKKHKHDLMRVPQTPANCTEEGNIEYYFCTGCNDCFTDAGAKNKISETVSVMVGALGHSASDKWNSDAQYHWRTCSVCTVVLEETKMFHKAENEKCLTCGHVMASGQANTEYSCAEESQSDVVGNADAEIGSSENDSTETTQKEQDSMKPGKSGVSWVGAILIGVFTFGAAVTASVIVLKMRKK